MVWMGAVIIKTDRDALRETHLDRARQHVVTWLLIWTSHAYKPHPLKVRQSEGPCDPGRDAVAVTEREKDCVRSGWTQTVVAVLNMGSSKPSWAMKVSWDPLWYIPEAVHWIKVDSNGITWLSLFSKVKCMDLQNSVWRFLLSILKAWG